MNKSFLFFCCIHIQKTDAIIQPEDGSQDLVRSSHISAQTDEPCRFSCCSAGMAVLQRPCSREERLTHDSFSPVAPHVATNHLGFLFSIPPSLEKGSLGNPCDPTQAAVYYCWFLSRALEAVNTRQNGPREENTNDKMHLFDPKYQSSNLRNLE